MNFSKLNLQIGQSIRLPHETSNCAGSSKALQVSRDERGYFAFCHRCGYRKTQRDKMGKISGYLAEGREKPLEANTRDLASWVAQTVQTVSERLQIEPNDVFHKLDSKYVPVECIKWVSESNIPAVYLGRFRWIRGVGLFCHIDKDNWFIRRFGDRVRKYGKVRNFISKPYQAYTDSGTSVLIVEDYMSYLRVLGMGGNSVCLFGTELKMDKELLDKLKDKRILICLDNDNYTVKFKQLKVKDLLAACGIVSRIIYLDRDVKHLDVDVLRHLLKDNRSH